MEIELPVCRSLDTATSPRGSRGQEISFQTIEQFDTSSTAHVPGDVYRLAFGIVDLYPKRFALKHYPIITWHIVIDMSALFVGDAENDVLSRERGSPRDDKSQVGNALISPENNHSVVSCLLFLNRPTRVQPGHPRAHTRQPTWR